MLVVVWSCLKSCVTGSELWNLKSRHQAQSLALCLLLACRSGCKLLLQHQACLSPRVKIMDYPSEKLWWHMPVGFFDKGRGRSISRSSQLIGLVYKSCIGHGVSLQEQNSSYSMLFTKCLSVLLIYYIPSVPIFIVKRAWIVVSNIWTQGVTQL